MIYILGKIKHVKTGFWIAIILTISYIAFDIAKIAEI